MIPPSNGLPTEKERLRVLMVAYACSPTHGGEHLLGWEWASRMALRHDVTVLTSQHRLHQSDGMRPPSLAMVGVDDRLFRPLKRLGPVGFHVYYWLWHRSAARMGLQLIAQDRFDVVHQVTFHSCRVRGRLAAPGNPPFVWGPVAGLEEVPPRLWGALGSSLLVEAIRSISNWISPRMPGVRRTLRNSHSILVSNTDTLRRLAHVVNRDFLLMPANAVADVGPAIYTSSGDPLRLVAIGSIVRMRAYEFVLRAIAGMPRSQQSHLQLRFIGDGRDQRRLAALAKRLDLTSVEFLGRVPRTEALDAMRKAHLLVFPSLRDSGGSSVSESLALGVPVLALDLAGPAAMLSRGGGLLIRPGRPAQVIADIRELLERVVVDRDVLQEASTKARSAARELFRWDERIELVDGIYRRAAGQ